MQRDARFLRKGLKDVRNHLARQVADLLSPLLCVTSRITIPRQKTLSVVILGRKPHRDIEKERAARTHQAEFGDAVGPGGDVDHCAAESLHTCMQFGVHNLERQESADETLMLEGENEGERRKRKAALPVYRRQAGL